MDRYDAADEIQEAREAVERVLGDHDDIPAWLWARCRKPLEAVLDELTTQEMAMATDRPHPGEEDQDA